MSFRNHKFFVVVISTAKIANFEQITTDYDAVGLEATLSFLPQR